MAWKIRIEEEKDGQIVKREITALSCYFIDPEDNKAVWSTPEGEVRITQFRIRAVVERKVSRALKFLNNSKIF